MSVEIILEETVFETVKSVAGFIFVYNDEDDDPEQFDFIIEATYDHTTEDERYLIKWSDKKPKKRKQIEADIVMNYKLSNY
jgi:hypothetical protein